ncbi:MAG: DnaJ family molecular chaperone [Hoeflea sp.]|uniref:DnaJ family molecular chaperone n=1 Tax=Hoeflea sp. TaxID=1940281 RepID=UPI001D5521C0|nr:DnaJ family molecular chaperone [Hoeflea sp.]MBU4529983.1 DnaJ family molecular chaperone [Alphaproteobacteria bacterium]MBU4543210.1 DnaJ family molecular chaperone [Alphaproteobacteria bacterium]MBU4550250.1 DnaJ family molecular chaperone [Alphaproteobacteria bacterium]MBV1722476.1 DnaJ family molecular chaperone [Hoeflea sp.]MBV1761626.1 DnaJ family molecular chaperone [Hoeflea sp.]
MSLFSRLFDAIGDTASTAFSGIVEAVRTVFSGDPETRRRVAFSIAVIALSAKMAKADGIVAPEEVRAFQEIFTVPEAEAQNVARLYNLAKQDVAGYEIYAQRVAGMCGSGVANCAMLEDVLDGLFHIAKADGVIHHKELEFIANVADIFRVDEAHFDRILARHVHPDGIDPYAVLGLAVTTPFDEVKKRYRALASESHPDRLRARGVPDEFLTIANDRMAALNDAFAVIEKARAAA